MITDASAIAELEIPLAVAGKDDHRPAGYAARRGAVGGTYMKTGKLRSMAVFILFGGCLGLLFACGGGGGAAGTPAEPPISVGLGNVSFVVPFRAPSIVAFQMSDGNPDP